MTSTENTDLFGRPSPTFPKVEDFENRLILIIPSEVQTVRNRFDKDGSKPTVERATADVIVFEDDGEVKDEIEDMFLSQTVLLNACKSALKPGHKPMIFARLVKVPTKETVTALKIDDTPEAYAAAREKWLKGGGKGTEPKHVWVLAEYTDEEANYARRYLAKRDAFATPAE